ncbi:DUF6228 family protein [Variovorax paradoxus]|uniref:DUF6228 family protein n=1 Tax=Variovorax paradoxus TaxID=34073 RepID=UPI003D654408
MTTLGLKSPHDGSVLMLSITRWADTDTEFEVAVRTPWFTGRAQTSCYHNGSPVEMFLAMARDWRGWTGEKQWQDIEGQVIFIATADATGHVELIVELRKSFEGSLLRVVIQYEAGQLEDMAEAVAGLFEAPQPRI